jgi:hypothetical protein
MPATKTATVAGHPLRYKSAADRGILGLSLLALSVGFGAFGMLCVSRVVALK